jgi:hypothetical protein
MKSTTLAGAALAFSVFLLPAAAADDTALARLALCQDSWVDWNKSDPGRLQAFIEHFRSEFSPSGNDPFFLPKGSPSIAGLHVVQAFPQSVGMGVGFSLTVDATFDETRTTMEKALGKPLQKCESGDGMRMCEFKIAEQRTFTLMAEDDPKSHNTLIGCYYFYEK